MRRLEITGSTVDKFRKRIIVISVLVMTVMSGCGKTVDTSDNEDDAIKGVSYEEVDMSVQVDKVYDTDSSVNSTENITASSDEMISDISAANEATAQEEDIKEEPSLSNIEGVDIDLTALSSTVVYGQVYNMMYYPEKFVGKTIRMDGVYSDYFDEAKGKHYFACIIMDATACCAQGVEFELTQDYSYPEEYPSEGDYCVVEGVFETYEEDGAEYCTLKNARLIQDS